jgi:peptidoglycan/xylan/chitin deacetylase (PgdA/CDA1 family)
LISRLRETWRKNAPELLGFLNGSLPPFVTGWGAARVSGAVPVYSYHVVERSRFAADLQFLRRNRYRALTLDELLDRVTGRTPFGERELVLTFDDGPCNFFDVAFPVLRGHDFASTVFIAPGLHADDYGSFQDSEHRPMTWDELREVHASGLVSIQSHTLQSQYVPRWPAAASLAGVDPRIEAALRRPPLPMDEDFRLAREIIEAQCPGAVVRHLCFPMYHATAAAREALQSAGYVAGYGGLIPRQPMVMRSSDPWLLPRLSGEFLRRMEGEGRVGLLDLLQFRFQDASAARQRSQIYARPSR